MSAKKQLESRRLSRNLHKIVSSSFPYTILSILVGFIAGGIALLIAGYNPLEAYASLFRAIFLNAKTGQASLQRPHITQDSFTIAKPSFTETALFGQLLSQFPQPTHRLLSIVIPI